MLWIKSRNGVGQERDVKKDKKDETVDTYTCTAVLYVSEHRKE